MPEETWARMLMLLWGVLIGAAVPLAVLSPLRWRRGKKVAAMWLKYSAWFIMAPLITVPLILGRYWIQAAFLVMSLYAFEEYSRAVGLWRHRPHVWLARTCIVLIYVPVAISWFALFVAMPAYLIIIIFAFPVARDEYEGMIQRTCLTVLGVLYFGWFLAHLAFLMNVAAGRALLPAFLLVVVVNDSAAYLIGSSFGRRPLVPKMSPNKTVEGTLGALAITMGVMFAVRFALGEISLLHLLLLGFLLSVGGTVGDLTISMIKRDVHIKDAGRLIPGHGGLLDRLDSIIFTAPIFFYFMKHFCDVLAPIL